MRKVFALVMVLFMGAALAQLSSDYAYADSLSAAISIDSTGVLSSDHLVVTISGTYRCGPLPQPQGGMSFATFSCNLSQASGREIATGTVGFDPVCDDQVHPIELPVHAQNIPWHGGKARVMANLNVQSCGTYPCETVSSTVDKGISIKGGGK